MRSERFYWEFVNTLRKFLIIVINVFLSTAKPQTRALLAIITIVALIRIGDKIKPYKLKIFNTLQSREAMTSVLTLYGGMFFIDSDSSLGVVILVMVIIFLINIWFFQLWILALCQSSMFRKYFGRIKILCSKIIGSNKKMLAEIRDS